MSGIAHPLRAAMCGFAAAFACALPAAAGVVETGTIAPQTVLPDYASYEFLWDSDGLNRLVLDLEFTPKAGAPSPTSTNLFDEVFYGEFYKPDPSASNEYFGGCGGLYICNAEFLAAPPGVTRVRYTTYWGDHGDSILFPLSPIRITFEAFYPGAGLTEGPFDATYTIRAVPEPATWAILLLGFGAVGGALRRRRQALAA